MITSTHAPEYKKVDSYIFDVKSKPLGLGAFATVYKGYDTKNNNKEVAVKMISAAKLAASEENYKLLTREIELLRGIKGENMVHLLDVKITTNNLYIFTDYCNGGDLATRLHKNSPLSEDEALKILRQIAECFISLTIDGSKAAIMHRDIKPPNILFHNGDVKIADFGFAKIVDENSKDVESRHTLLGTPLYMNPQTLGDQPFSTKCDIWSAGVVIYECIFGRLPWTGTTILGLLNNIKKIPLDFPKPVTEETKDLIRKMLQIKEENRIDWKGILEHPALKKDKEKEKTAEKEKSKPKTKIVIYEQILCPSKWNFNHHIFILNIYFYYLFICLFIIIIQKAQQQFPQVNSNLIASFHLILFIGCARLSTSSLLCNIQEISYIREFLDPFLPTISFLTYFVYIEGFFLIQYHQKDIGLIKWTQKMPLEVFYNDIA